MNTSRQILSVLEYIEKEKGISRDEVIPVIANAIKSAAEKGLNAGQNLKIEIDPQTGDLKAWALQTVVDSVGDPKIQLSLEEALLIDEKAHIGQILQSQINPADLGRIVAQTARQAILQRFRELGKERIYNAYKNTVGEIVSGVVQHRERSGIIIELQRNNHSKVEALLPAREQIPGENYSLGNTIRCLLRYIKSTNRGPEIILSRSDKAFVQRLLEIEVAEIRHGTVQIVEIARNPGYRTKISVVSNDPKVDPVGACVGARGARVKAIVGELGGEKVDIVNYESDPVKFLEAALKPAIPYNVRVNESNRCLYFQLNEADFATAIGIKGRNAKLVSQLLGWKLDISKKEQRESEFDPKRFQRSVDTLSSIGIDKTLARQLVVAGFTSLETFEGVSAQDLIEAIVCKPEVASEILQKSSSHTKHSSEPRENKEALLTHHHEPNDNHSLPASVQKDV